MDIFKSIILIFFIYWLYKHKNYYRKEGLTSTQKYLKKKKIILKLNDEKEILRNF
jgi:hypothetical protein